MGICIWEATIVLHNTQHAGSRWPSFSDIYYFTCAALEALPVGTLPPA